ncbi:MAG: hypothetical protein NTX01_03900 [Candidatus Omnitrophica bacterium]|nr:hypothetical protein [Candidatus Omnitrophota bacterium]
MKQFIAFILLICLFLTGCVAGEANRYYLKEKLPAKKINEVEVLKEKPARPYIVIADFQASQASFKHLQKRASEIGADAVIVTCTGGSYSTSEIWAEKDRYSNTCTGFIGTAIKYKTE